MSGLLNWGLPILAVAIGIALLIWDDYRTGSAPAPAPESQVVPGYRVVVEIAPASRPTPTRTVAPRVLHEARNSRPRLDQDWQQLMAAHPELRSLDDHNPNTGD